MGAPELVHVATMKAPLGEQLVVGAGAMGMRIIAEVDDVTVEGERLTASLAVMTYAGVAFTIGCTSRRVASASAMLVVYGIVLGIVLLAPVRLPETQEH